MSMKLFWVAILGVGTAFAGACGGSGANQPAPTLATASAGVTPVVTPEMLEKDPMSLFPSGTLGMFAVDMKAFYGSASAGPSAAQLAEKYFPIGQEAGFSPSKDLDRVTGGFYSMQGADVLATLVGRFDEAKIAQVAASKTQLHGGGLLVASQYAGRTLYTVSDAGFTVLSPHLVIAGTKTTMKRALDRIRDAHLAHDATPWMLQTLATPAAVASLALDTKSMPLSSVTGGFPLKGTDGMTAIRLLGNFQPPGMHVAGAATYSDADKAKAGADGLRSLFSSTAITVLTGAVGVTIKDVNVQPAQSDAQVAFTVDDASLKNLLQRLPSVFGG